MLATWAGNIEFVVIAGLDVRYEQFPITGAAHAHWMAASVPKIEVADDADPLRVRRKHHESDAVDAIQGHGVRAEFVIEALVGAFTEEIKVEVAQHRRKTIGVVEIDDLVAKLRAQLIPP